MGASRQLRATKGPSVTNASHAARRIVPETFVAILLVPAAAIMIAGYLIDTLGGPIAPSMMAIVGVLSGLAAFAGVRRVAAGNGVDAEAGAGAATLVVVAVAGTYFMWLASPSFFPVTNGPDVVHHLMLIHLIQRTHHLAHDPALNVYLLEMAGYTPGSHILAASIATWLRLDAVRVVHPVASWCAALALGIVYLLAYRILDASRGAAWKALAAPLLALMPAAYTLGAFLHFFYFAQLVSGTFALGMLLGGIEWARGRAAWAPAFCSICAAGVVLSWPVWIVPPVLGVAASLCFGGDARRRLAAMGLVVLPALLLVVIHSLQHRGAERILTGGGAVLGPSVPAFGAGFLVCASAGAAIAVATRVAMPVAVFAAGVGLEALGLAVLSRLAGSGAMYLPYKMMFLLVPPGAVLGALALARVVDAAGRLARLGSAAAEIPPLIAAFLLSGRVPTRRQQGWITPSALAAGEWARANLPRACVDYISAYWLTGYWLHLDVLGNPRVSKRMANETFEFRDVVGKWIEGRGLPYAFVDNFDAVPKDARTEMTVVYRSGPAAIVRNRRPAACVDELVPPARGAS